MDMWKLTINFRAEDEEDAKEQYEDAMLSFHTVVDDKLERTENDGA